MIFIHLRNFSQLLNNAALAEEVVDDVIFYLWEHRQEVEIRYSIRAYLMRAVRNRCLNELQLQSHREELHISSFLSPESMDFLDSLFVDNKQPLGMLLEQELEEELKRSIDELPLECRKVFIKVVLNRKSTKRLLLNLVYRSILLNTI